MRKLHLEQCHSTQEVLLERLKSGNMVELVSTDLQTQGKGRHTNQWHQLGHTLCFSFICPPNEVLTLTSLEMSELICRFFEQQFKQKLFVKWPNDILDHLGRKCAGILINHVEHKSVVGVGLNLFSAHDDQEFSSDYPVGFIFKDEVQYEREALAEGITRYIHGNRLTPNELHSSWENRCIHLNRPVLIKDGTYALNGTFVGIGKHGEALVEAGPTVHKIYNGNLRIQDRV